MGRVRDGCLTRLRDGYVARVRDVFLGAGYRMALLHG